MRRISAAVMGFAARPRAAADAAPLLALIPTSASGCGARRAALGAGARLACNVNPEYHCKPRTADDARRRGGERPLMSDPEAVVNDRAEAAPAPPRCDSAPAAAAPLLPD